MRRRSVLATGVFALAAGAFLAPHAPPLYDGIGFPDEPYRYAQVLASDPVKTPPPTTATATGALAAGSNAAGIVLTTGESGPQLLAYVPAGAIRSSTTGSALTLSATPLAPDRPPPAEGPIAGDVYRIATATPASWHPGSNGTISLRSPQGIPVTPGMVFRRAGQRTWTPLPTTRVGNDIWESPLGALGDYALALPEHAATAAAPKSNTLVYVLVAVVVCAAASLLGARLALRQKPVSDGQAGASKPN